MGYSTYFDGTLLFTETLTAPQIVQLQKMCGEDCRQHPEWRYPEEDTSQLTWIDLQLNDDYTGLIWNEDAENTQDLPKKINLILDVMRRTWPTFGLRGKLRAQGEEPEDRWNIIINNEGYAEEVEIMLFEFESGDELTCPHCHHQFVLPVVRRAEND